MRIGLQLYTIRDHMERDFWGALDKVASMGYRNVQLAGLFGNEPLAVRDGLAKRKLKPISPHVGLDDLEKRFDATVKMAKELGVNRLTLPWIADSVYAEGWAKVAKRFDQIGQRLHDKGLEFSYHNHAFEFKPEGGKPGLDVLFETANDDLVQAEIDLYWVTKGGGDPVAYLNKLAGRCPTLHFKDMAKAPDDYFTELGAGRLDWTGIIKAAKAAKSEYAIVENDAPKMDSLESVRISRDFLIKAGLRD